MNFEKVKIIVLFLMSTILADLLAQENVVTAGGNAFENSGSVSFTIGQVAFNNNLADAGTENQGVQQPYEIYLLAIAEAGIIECQVYPNPATEQIIIKVEDYQTSNLRYRLLDLYGRLLVENSLIGMETIIPIQEFPSSSYYLVLSDQKENTKTFIIIKH